MAVHLTVDVLPGRMVEVTEKVGDAPIVDVATDHDKLLLVVHLHKKIKKQSTLLLRANKLVLFCSKRQRILFCN